MASGSARTRSEAVRQAAAGGEPDSALDGPVPVTARLGNTAVARLLAGTDSAGSAGRAEIAHHLATAHHVGNHAVARMSAGAATAGAATETGLIADIDAQRGGGAPLPDAIRAPMQSHLGSDLEGVRVHTDATAATLARSVDAEAFTSGQDVFFAEGRYDPGSSTGRELIAHEVVHVAQQRPAQVGFFGRVSDPADPAEVEARSLGPALARSVEVAGPAAAGPVSATAGADLHRQPAAGTAAPDLGSTLSVAALEDLRQVATEVTMLAGAYAERGYRTVDTLKASLVTASDTYTQAYETYADVIRAAGAEARDQQDWINIIVGIGIGTGVGLIASAVVPEGLALGWVVLAEVAGEGVEAAVAAGVQATGITDVAGADLEPGGLDPHVLSTGVWRKLADLYRGVLGVQRHTQYLPLVLGGTEYALGQFRLLDAGAEADMDRATLVDMAVTLNRAGAHLRQLKPVLQQRLEALGALQEQAAATPRRPVAEVEKDVWLLWMDTVPSSQSDVLDLDEIEDHLAAIGLLGSGGDLGVDFGMWTSEDDERAALSAARSKAAAVHERYRALSQ